MERLECKTDHPNPRSLSESSVEDPGLSGNKSDYTSGALSSDYDFITRQVRQAQVPYQTKSAERVSPNSANLTQVEISPEGMELSPGYTAAKYQPLAQLYPPPTESPRAKRPARKKTRITGSSRKVMKEAYFKGIKWTKTFVTGPLDPEHNRHQFYCQKCKTNVSNFSKGPGR